MKKNKKIFFMSFMLTLTMILSLFVCINAAGTSSDESVIIHYYTEDDSPNIYYWNSLPKNKEVDWPGKKMDSEGNKWYKYEINSVSKINFLFNAGDKQTEDLSVNKSGEYWYKDGKLTNEKPDKEEKEEDPKKEDPEKEDPKPQEYKEGTSLAKTDSSRKDMRDDSIYFVITTRFYDGYKENNFHCQDENKATPEGDPAWRGDFKGLIDKLDYIKALGFSAIWITPIVENNSSLDYHGYHAFNFSKIDSRLESEGGTFSDLIDACHKKGIKLIQDVVYNHTCNWGEENLVTFNSEEFQDWQNARSKVMVNGKGDPDNYYHHNGYSDGGGFDKYDCQIMAIHSDCFDLNTENPAVDNYLNKCYTNYINMGVDGFRIDTARHVSRLTWNKSFLPAIREAGGDDFFAFGEVCTRGHDVWYRDLPSFSTCFYTWQDDDSWLNKWSDTDQAANNALVKEHFDALADKNKQPTSDNALLKGNEYHKPDYSKKSDMNVIDFQMHYSFENAGSAFDMGKREDPYFNDSTYNIVYVYSHDFSADCPCDIVYDKGTDAWAENLDLMFTFRGIPCIYYGSEIEFQKGKKIDDGPGTPLNNTGRAYFGDNIEGNVTATDFGEYEASGQVSETLNYPLAQHIIRLNKIRRAIPALRKGQYSTEGCGGGMAYKRRYTDEDVDSFVCVTISGDAKFTGIPDGEYVDAVTGDKVTVSGGTLDAKCSGQGNMRVYVLNNKSGISGKIGEGSEFFN